MAAAGLAGLAVRSEGTAGEGTKPAAKSQANAGGELLIRNAHVLSMDPAIGDVPDGSIHVRGGAIVAVGKDVTAPGATVIDARGMIAVPGFVDGHCHCWNTLHRGLTRKGRGYMDLSNGLGPHYLPQDHYRANRLVLTEAASAGITTVLNWAHNVRGPAYADAEIKAFADSGVRGRYAYGFSWGQPRDKTMDLDDLKRVQNEWFSPSSPHGGRVHLGIAWRGPQLLKPEIYMKEVETARSLGLPITTHAGNTPPEMVNVPQMQKEGLLGPDMLLVHLVFATREYREILVATKTSLCLTVLPEQRHPNARPPVLESYNAGVNVCLGTDSAALSPVDMFSIMQNAYLLAVPWSDRDSAQMEMLDYRPILEMATIKGARALGLGDVVGSLTPGKRADVVLVRATDLNLMPYGADPDALIVRWSQPANVDTVIVDGRILKRGGKMVGTDTVQVARDASQALYELRKRAGGAFAPTDAAWPV